MLISRKHRFIFVHIYKTAGTSVTAALMPFAANSLQLKANKLLKKMGITYFDPQPYFKHASAAEIISEMGLKRYRSYFSFAIVRNPWDWQVSLYKYILRVKGHPHHKLVKSFSDFGDYLAWRCSGNVLCQSDFLFSKEGEKLVDYIGKYENLEKDFESICSRLGISAKLPKLNITQGNPYQEYYNHRTAQLIKTAYEPDIKLFNYHFE